MAKVEIRGDIISNDLKWIYDWLEWESTCPNDIKKVIDSILPEEELRVTVNSGGGEVFAGTEIYTLLRKKQNSISEIESLAGSAAGVAAMGAAKVVISPVAMIMLHNVSMSVDMSGDYHEFEKNAEALKEMNRALAMSYTEKTGKTMDEILAIMDRETWVSAGQAVEMGFADEIMGGSVQFTNTVSGLRLTEDIKRRVIAEKSKVNADEKLKCELLKDLDMYGI